MSRAALTVRLEGPVAVVSSDDGRTHTLNPAAAAQIRRCCEAATDGDATASAAARAGIGEARALRPVDAARGVTDHRPLEPGIPLAAMAHERTMLFAALLEARASERMFGPMALDDLATLLVRCGRTRGWRSTADGATEESRPLPSAGARHAVHFEVVSLNVEGLGAGHWRFDHVSCELVEVARPGPASRVLAALADLGIDAASAGAVVFAVAEFERTRARYPAGATLVWRDAGVVLCGLHLCATDLALASCITAPTGVLHHGGSADSLVDLGAVVVGGPMRARPGPS